VAFYSAAARWSVYALAQRHHRVETLAMSNVTADCPRCSQRLRIAPERMPKAGQTLGLVCPRCRERWQWSASGHAAIRELGFQCAHSEQRFAVLYAKEHRDTKFRVRAVEQDGQVIKRLLASPDAALSPRGHTAEPIANASWAAIEFDHSGWRCPHCRSRGVETNTFVKCGSCNTLVCGASLLQVHGGGRTFRCPCGAHAEVLDGLIASFEGRSTNVAFHPRGGGERALSSRQDGGAAKLGQSPRPLWGLLPRRGGRS
jgi:hypothetical protein